MEGQTILEYMVVEYETIVDEEDVEEPEAKESRVRGDKDGPHDLADQAYEQWRDEERQKDLIL